MIDRIKDQYGTRETQEELLRMLKDVHAFCVSRDIPYSIADGTLLGAVREGGFIPWDDDVDLMFSREAYEKFVALSGELEGYTVTRRLWIYRIQPVNAKTSATIDVLIMDKAPNGRFARLWKQFCLMVLQGMVKDNVSYEGLSLPYKICVAGTHFLGRLLPRKWKLSLYDAASQIGHGCQTDTVSCTNDSFSTIALYYGRNIMQNLELRAFEDTELYAVRDTDYYLTVLYEDYMTPPPEDKRHPLHG